MITDFFLWEFFRIMHEGCRSAKWNRSLKGRCGYFNLPPQWGLYMLSLFVTQWLSYIQVVDMFVMYLLSGLMHRDEKARLHKDMVNALLSLLFLENEGSDLCQWKLQFYNMEGCSLMQARHFLCMENHRITESLVLRIHDQFICLLLSVFSLPNKLTHSLELGTIRNPFSLSVGLSQAKQLHGLTKQPSKFLAWTKENILGNFFQLVGIF